MSTESKPVAEHGGRDPRNTGAVDGLAAARASIRQALAWLSAAEDRITYEGPNEEVFAAILNAKRSLKKGLACSEGVGS